MENYENYTPYIMSLIIVILLSALLAFSIKVANFFRLLKRKTVFLEMTPPANTARGADATQSLFAALHGLESNRSLTDKLLRRKAVLSLEITSTKKDGIRYVACLSQNDAKAFEHTVNAYLPDVRFKELNEGSATNRTAQVALFRQSGHFAYPLQEQGDLIDHDPIAYLTGAMTKLSSTEEASLQLLIAPVKSRTASRLAKRIMHNEELLHSLGRRRYGILGSFFGLLHSVLVAILDGLSDIVSGPPRSSQPQNTNHQQQVAAKIKPARTLSPLEQELADAVNHKLTQPLFAVDIRARIDSPTSEEKQQRLSAFRDWAALFTMQKYQALRKSYDFPFKLRNNYRLFLYKNRLPSYANQNTSLFSATELAALFHFPHNQSSRIENVSKSLSRTLPAPISLKGNTQFDIIVGKNKYQGQETPIGLTAADRERHVYMIGGTGNGKTTLLEYTIVQSIRKGEGLAVVDPHGDMAEKLLRFIPEDRINDVVYFNPDDLSYPVGLNILELTPGLSSDDLLREKDIVTESVISIFRKIFSDDDTGGHRIEYVLRNAIQTALTIEDATLFTVYNLLNDPKYCKKIVATLENEDLRNFWKNELGKAGGFQQVKMVAGITSKIGRFLFSASAKRILEQPKSTINFDEILDGKILICNLSKGLLGEDTSELFGISILAKLQLASLHRARKAQENRKPFYLFVDEFQNFATPSFVQMLSEARKYRLFLTMAEQSTSQQDDQQMVNIILANVGTVICFRSGNPADERMILPLFQPYIETGEIANLPSYNFYMRISAVNAQEPFSGETLLLPDKGSDEIAKRAHIASRKNYAIEFIEQPKEQRATPTSKPKQAKLGNSLPEGRRERLL